MSVQLYCQPGFSFAFTGHAGKPVTIAGECTLDGQDWEKARRFDQVKAGLESGSIWEGAESVFRVADAGALEAFPTESPANDTTDPLDIDDTLDREG